MAEETVVIRIRQDMLVEREWLKAGAVVGVPKARAKSLCERKLAERVADAGSAAAATKATKSASRK